MPKKDERKTAKHIVAFLKESEGNGYRFVDLSRILYAKGYRHNNSTLIDNLRWLVGRGEITKVGYYYGLPIVKNGEKILSIKTGGTKATIKIE
jgi:hypothetical protein